MEAPTIKPFSELAECVKCGAGDPSTQAAIAMFGVHGPIHTRYCAGGKSLEEEQEKNPVESFLSMLPQLAAHQMPSSKPRINICAGIGEEHLHKTCPRCGYEWLTGTKPS